MSAYYGIGIYNCKKEVNVGTLWRSAFILGAAYIFTVGARYKHQSSDTVKAYRSIPFFQFDTFDDFKKHLPRECVLVGIEIAENSEMLARFAHPKQACYLLGAEDNGIPIIALEQCHKVVRLPGDYCLNVSTAGSIVMYDRITRGTL